MLDRRFNMLQFLNYLRSRIKFWRDNRFLKRHGCDTWKEYYHRFDPDCNIRASRVKDYYHGYPYWHVIDNHGHHCYNLLYDYGPGGHRYGYHDILDWCETNCQDKHRADFMRVIKCPATANEWETNELGGKDYMFVAFKNERDYFMFMLKWA
jgi:hypothetical protein